MKNLMISATDSNLEHYAVDMFKSFRRIDKETPMMCICHKISEQIWDDLFDIGVILTPYIHDPSKMRNVSVIVDDYLPDDIHEIMWMDIDALFLHSIPEVWERKEDIVALPGNGGNKWKYTSLDGSEYLALGMWKASRGMFRDIKELFLTYSNLATIYSKEKPLVYKDGYPYPDEGRFIRRLATLQSEGKFLWDGGNLTISQLDGPIYYCGREMVELLEYNDGKLAYKINGDVFYPKCLQFNRKYDDQRPVSEAVQQWIRDHL